MDNRMSGMLLDEKASKGLLIAAHRGCSGGNIVENTIGAFEAALFCGADILEMDVFRTVDSKLYVFHDGMEQRLFWQKRPVVEMTGVEVDRLRFINQNSLVTEEGPPPLDDVLEHFKNRCLINLDRCWWCWDSVFRLVLRHGMQDQILFKSPAKQEYLEAIAAQETPFMYLPIVRTLEDVERADRARVNLVAVETVFPDGGSPLVCDGFIAEQHRKKRFLWANAITLCASRSLTDRHDDDSSILGRPNEGWEWLIGKGYDIIQTDWPFLLKEYLIEEKNKPTETAAGRNKPSFACL